MNILLNNMLTKNTIAAIILTYNEEKHLARCINSLNGIVNEMYVIDSYSNDQTVKIATELGAKIYYNKWKNYATQFNWALENCAISTEWIWRIDADEYIDNPNYLNIQEYLQSLSHSINGIYVKRKILFLGKEILHGGWYPVWHLKIWRNGKGYCENRWMDEHIKLEEGDFTKLNIDQIDDNLNDLTWWTNKHNSYATRELVDLLDTKYKIFNKEIVEPNPFGTDEQRKRWLKIRYSNIPLFIRPFLYFIYRYFIKMGFLDGLEGLLWNILQGFWYRFLVDAKIYELRKKFKNNDNEIITYIRKHYNV